MGDISEQRRPCDHSGAEEEGSALFLTGHLDIATSKGQFGIFHAYRDITEMDMLTLLAESAMQVGDMKFRGKVFYLTLRQHSDDTVFVGMVKSRLQVSNDLQVVCVKPASVGLASALMGQMVVRLVLQTVYLHLLLLQIASDPDDTQRQLVIHPSGVFLFDMYP